METLTKNKLSSGFIKKLEQVEIAYWMKYYHSSDHIRTFASIIDKAFVGAIPDLDILAMNRTIGLGINNKLSAKTLQEVINFYKSVGSKRFFIQLTPNVLDDQRIRLSENGFSHRNNWIKLYKPVTEPDFPVNPDLKITQIDKRDAYQFGEIIFRSFDWEDNRIPAWLASSVGAPGYRHYFVHYQGHVIAAGALFVDGEMASMAFAGTLTTFRGLGAQRLLLKKRLKDAHKLGAKFITSETGKPRENYLVKSFDNMIKVGFEIAYERQNWIYEF